MSEFINYFEAHVEKLERIIDHVENNQSDYLSRFDVHSELQNLSTTCTILSVVKKGQLEPALISLMSRIKKHDENIIQLITQNGMDPVSFDYKFNYAYLIKNVGVIKFEEIKENIKKIIIRIQELIDGFSPIKTRKRQNF